MIQAQVDRPAPGDPAAGGANPVRSGDDARDGVLPRDRELLEAPYGTGSGGASAHLIDYFPKDFPDLSLTKAISRFPSSTACISGDQSGREPWWSTGSGSLCPGQPAAQLRRVRGARSQVFYVSATPSDYELKKSGGCVEQVIRPTGLVDPRSSSRRRPHQVDDLLGEIRRRGPGERVLVTTLTKRMAEDLTEYYRGIRHQGPLPPLGREDPRADGDHPRPAAGRFDVLVGINLLREGLDLPEVALVAILDADKEGFLRSRTFADPDDRAGGEERKGNGYPLRGHDDRARWNGPWGRPERRRAIQLAFNGSTGLRPRP